jgi:hypothetical protein
LAVSPGDDLHLAALFRNRRNRQGASRAQVFARESCACYQDGVSDRRRTSRAFGIRDARVGASGGLFGGARHVDFALGSQFAYPRVVEAEIGGFMRQIVSRRERRRFVDRSQFGHFDGGGDQFVNRLGVCVGSGA